MMTISDGGAIFPRLRNSQSRAAKSNSGIRHDKPTPMETEARTMAISQTARYAPSIQPFFPILPFSILSLFFTLNRFGLTHRFVRGDTEGGKWRRFAALYTNFETQSQTGSRSLRESGVSLLEVEY